MLGANKENMKTYENTSGMEYNSVGPWFEMHASVVNPANMDWSYAVAAGISRQQWPGDLPNTF